MEDLEEISSDTTPNFDMRHYLNCIHIAFSGIKNIIPEIPNGFKAEYTEEERKKIRKNMNRLIQYATDVNAALDEYL